MRNLSTKGLSMSQAQSISNMCNQRAQEIANTIVSINNVSKTINVNGIDYIETEGSPMPGNITDLIREKAVLHACQGFLMEALKAKDSALMKLRTQQFVYTVPQPQYPDVEEPEMIGSVDEAWGWSQLSDSEYSEYIEADAMAAHIGQFIHKNGKLDQLRKELPNLSGLEWMTIEDGKKTPVKVTKHHTSEQLLDLYEDLAKLHREYEQRVNYFKAKVKNLVTLENARIHAENRSLMDAYQKEYETQMEQYHKEMNSWRNARSSANSEFEKNRELEINSTAALRINVDPRFQATIDKFLVKSED
jgi:hypothetical protein